MEKVEWGWVVMGKPKQFDQWQKDWLAGCEDIHIVNNNRGDSFGTPGSNDYFEFSGYLELVKSMRTEGPYIIVNDTWFKTQHSTQKQKTKPSLNAPILPLPKIGWQ